MARADRPPVQTFTIGFEDDATASTSARYARRSPSASAPTHHEFVVEPDAVDLVERLVWHHDQPFGDSSAVPTFLLSELTRKHVTVALSGDGGDELFAGYERFAAALAARRYGGCPGRCAGPPAPRWARLPPAALRGGWRALQRFAARPAWAPADAYRCWLSFVPDARRARLLAPAPTTGRSTTTGALWQRVARAPSRSTACSTSTCGPILLDDLLPKMDRMSMAHGLEVRSPFPRRRPGRVRAAPAAGAEAARAVAQARAQGGGGRPAAARDPPPRKRGFGVPLDRWFRDDLAGDTWTARWAPTPPGPRAPGGGRRSTRLLAEHASGQRNHGHALWTLLTLEVFLRREGW